METFVIVSIFISGFLHAYWNFLLKSAEQPNLFIALSKILEASLLLLPFVYFQQHYPLSLNQLYLVVIAALLVFFSYYCLALAYLHLDMSIAYPVSRSSTLFLPLFAWFFLNEQLDAIGFSALMLITTGVVLLSFTGARSLSNHAAKLSIKGIGLALAVALISALQTIWSKIAIAQVHPFIYFYSYTLLVTIGYAVLVLVKYKAHAIRQQLTQHWPAMSLVAVLNTASYGLFLYALSKANTAYVGSLRQLSLVFALLLGYWLLKEALSSLKLLGTFIVIAGTVLVTLAG